MNPRVFTLIAASLGVLYFGAAALNWTGSNPRLFSIYLGMAVIGGCFHLPRLGMGRAFALNLPVVLLSMVQLDLTEAVAVGCAGALAQGLSETRAGSRLKHVLLAVCVVATVIATAVFAYRSVIPAALRNETVLLLLAAAALFFADSFPAAIVQRLRDSGRLGRIWRERFFWSFPYYLIAAIIANLLRGAGKTISLESALVALPAIWVAYRYYRGQKVQLEEREKYATETAALHLRAIEGLALAVEARDNLNTRGHLRRVQVYALGLAGELGLGAAELEALHAAALLHDIGKLAVPEHILTKPGKLTAEEFAKMKVHPLVGSEIVEQVQFPYPVAPIVRAHHEKYDGSGYPFGLKGEEIPFAARILAVADCLDAMTVDREYRRAMSLDEAVQWIAAESGRSFDPKVVEVLERRYRDLEAAAAGAGQPAMLSASLPAGNGRAPDAGLDLCVVSGLAPAARPQDFLGSIAAARREGQMLLEAAQGVGSSLDLTETFERVEGSLKSLVPYDAMAVLERRANALVSLHAAGSNAEVLSALQVPLGEGLTGWVALNGKPLVNGNPNVDPGFRCEPGAALNACLALPLQGPAGFSGVLALYRRRQDSFSRDDLRILAGVASKITVAIDNALVYRQMELRSNLDALTELPNSRLMMQNLDAELERARRQQQGFCITVCNLSGLAALRLSSGRDAGDELLRQVATAIKESCRRYDHVGRIGEDRFALILPGMTPQDMAVKASGLEAVVAGLAAASHPGTVRLVCGAAFYPEDGDLPKLLLAIAERRAEQHLADLTASITALDARVGRPAASPVTAETAPGR